MNPLHRWLILAPASLLCFSLSPLPILSSLSANAQTSEDRRVEANRFAKEARKQFIAKAETEVRQLMQQAEQQQKAKQFREALATYRQALKQAEQSSAPAIESTILQKIGDLHKQQQQTTEAMEAYQQALAIRKALKQPSRAGFVLLSIASLQKDTKQHARVLESYREALALFVPVHEVGNQIEEISGKVC